MYSEKKEDKFIGGKVPQELYWKFKQAYTQRKETATEAITNAINLYLDIKEESEEGGQNG